MKTNWPVITQVASVQDDETWTGIGCTLSRDTTDYVYGKESLKMVVNSGADATASCTLPSQVTIRHSIGIWVKVDDVAKVGDVKIELYETPTSGYHRLHLYYKTSSGFPLVNNTWHLIWVSSDCGWVAAYSPTEWGTIAHPTKIIQKIVMTVHAVSGQSPTAHIGGIIAQESSKAALVLTCDGPYSSAYTYTFTEFKKRGWPATLSCVVSKIDTSGFWTVAQLREANAAGWDVASHNYYTTKYTAATPASTVISNLVQAKSQLLDWGFYSGSQHHSWMANEGNCAADPNTGKRAGDIVKQYFLTSRGYTYFAVADGEGQIPSSWVSSVLSSWIPFNWYCLPYYALHLTNNTDFDVTAKGKFDLAIANRAVLSAYHHQISATPTAQDISITFFNQMLAYLDEKVAAGEIEVISMSQWYERVTMHQQDFKDFAVLAAAWLSQPGDANWNADCDISTPKDNIIDEKDLMVFCENWLN